MAKMKASVHFDQGSDKFAVKEFDIPAADENRSVIKIAYAGICGSDLHNSLKPITGPDWVMGHEFAGTITEVSPNAADFKIGDRVVIDPIENCGTCASCKAGLPQTCMSNLYYSPGFTHMTKGGYAQYASVRNDRMVKIPDNVSFEEAALVEPIAVAFRAVRKSGVKAGDSVVVIGGGIVGMYCCCFAKMQGARYVALVEVNIPKGQQVVDFGYADAVFDANDAKLAETLQKANGGEYDVGFDAYGGGKCIDNCIYSVKHGGNIMLVGLDMYGELGAPSLVVGVLFDQNFLGCMEYTPEEFALVLKLIETGKIEVKKCVSGKIGLDEIPETITRLLKRDSKDIKVLIDPDK